MPRMDLEDPTERLARLASMEKLSETLSDRDAGTLFQADLEEARALAAHDARFRPLAQGLASPTLGGRLAAVNRFFRSLDPTELATLELPAHLSQLRAIYLSSR